MAAGFACSRPNRRKELVLVLAALEKGSGLMDNMHEPMLTRIAKEALMHRVALSVWLVCFLTTTALASDWPTARANPARTGYTAENLPVT